MSLTGPHPLIITTSAFVTPIPVASTATVYTQSFSLRYKENFSLILLGTSDGTIDIGVWLELSDNLPTTEGSADATYTVENGAPVIVDVQVETQLVIPISPAVATYGRLKLIGGATNDASSTLAATLMYTENI